MISPNFFKTSKTQNSILSNKTQHLLLYNLPLLVGTAIPRPLNNARAVGGYAAINIKCQAAITVNYFINAISYGGKLPLLVVATIPWPLNNGRAVGS
jgi:hypothetical protein